jgi:hypothetical protein
MSANGWNGTAKQVEDGQCYDQPAVDFPRRMVLVLRLP